MDAVVSEASSQIAPFKHQIWSKLFSWFSALVDLLNKNDGDGCSFHLLNNIGVYSMGLRRNTLLHASDFREEAIVFKYFPYAPRHGSVSTPSNKNVLSHWSVPNLTVFG